MSPYPRNVLGAGGPVPACNVTDLPKGGAPQQFLDGHFLLANLDPTETRRAAPAAEQAC